MSGLSKRNANCDPFRSWCRLESRPRAAEFGRVLRAEIHDPLWMLTRQWQFGEFKGEDTGSAVFAKVELETTRVTRFRNSGMAMPLDNQLPLEARVERMPVQYDLRFRARAGKFYLKLLDKFGASYPGNGADVPSYADVKDSLRNFLTTLYPFEIPVIEQNDAPLTKVVKSRILSDKKVHQTLTALQGRALDGVALYEDLIQGGAVALPNKMATALGYDPQFEDLLIADAGTAFATWMQKNHVLPEDEQDISWEPRHMEYAFATALPNKGDVENTRLVAEEYHHGRLDWYAFDHSLGEDESGLRGQDPAEEADHVQRIVRTVIPTEARFAGMPNSRWWQFEDGYMDLGNITADTTDVAKILLAEFALVYSNDWFVIPYDVPAGSLSEVKGIIVTDAFGERTYVEAAAQSASNDWTGWTMYNLSLTSDSDIDSSDEKVDPRLYIPQVAAKVHESEPLEKVEMIRDEMANMVWSVETVIPDHFGGGKDGNASAQELKNYLIDYENRYIENAAPADEIPQGVKLKYQLGNTVPENWIPFLPTHLPDQNRAIQLQRASMPRWFDGTYTPVRPITPLMRSGMNEAVSRVGGVPLSDEGETQNSPYYVYEEEVPKTGVTLTANWQRTRWYNGETVCWYGRKKVTGRGQGASGLHFDAVIEIDQEGQRALEPAISEEED